MTRDLPVDISDLPGAEAILRGLEDHEAGRETVESLLVEIAAPRLRRLGSKVTDGMVRTERSPEVRLYERLGMEGVGDPYSRYNALLRELVSFERALEHRVWRARRAQRQRL